MGMKSKQNSSKGGQQASNFLYFFIWCVTTAIILPILVQILLFLELSGLYTIYCIHLFLLTQIERYIAPYFIDRHMHIDP